MHPSIILLCLPHAVSTDLVGHPGNSCDVLRTDGLATLVPADRVHLENDAGQQRPLHADHAQNIFLVVLVVPILENCSILGE